MTLWVRMAHQGLSTKTMDDFRKKSTVSGYSKEVGSTSKNCDYHKKNFKLNNKWLVRWVRLEGKVSIEVSQRLDPYSTQWLIWNWIYKIFLLLVHKKDMLYMLQYVVITSLFHIKHPPEETMLERARHLYTVRLIWTLQKVFNMQDIAVKQENPRASQIESGI